MREQKYKDAGIKISNMNRIQVSKDNKVNNGFMPIKSFSILAFTFLLYFCLYFVV